MVKVEETPPNKRKSLTKEKKNAKKGKFENGDAPSNSKQKQLSKKPKQQKENGTNGEASGPKKKKVRNVLTKIITEAKSKQGSKDPEVIKDLKEKIEAITSRGEPTKTAKKKLSILKKLLIIVEEGTEAAAAQTAATIEGQKKQKTENKAKATTQSKKTSAPPAKKQQEEAEEESDAEEEDDSDAEEEEGGDNDEEVKEKEGANDDEEEDEDNDNNEDEEDKPPAPKAKKPQPNSDQAKNEGKNKKRFVLFIGNIPFDATKDDLMQHFKKVGDIVDVRIPTEKGSNRPRGFAYLEVKNDVAYEKCLSMHHTQLKGRQINVLYTQGGKGEDAQKQVHKNLKLHAMRRQGKLAGSSGRSAHKKWNNNRNGDYQ